MPVSPVNDEEPGFDVFGFDVFHGSPHWTTKLVQTHFTICKKDY
jgi:hypothetical protein